MKALFIGSILFTIISAGLMPGLVVFLIACILTFVNFVVWITCAPREEDLWSVPEQFRNAVEPEDGA